LSCNRHHHGCCGVDAKLFKEKFDQAKKENEALADKDGEMQKQEGEQKTNRGADELASKTEALKITEGSAGDEKQKKEDVKTGSEASKVDVEDKSKESNTDTS